MRQVLGDTLRGVGVSEDSVADILLAVTEACTNVVLHSESAGTYDVAVTLHGFGFRVEIRDSGVGCRFRPVRAGNLPEHGRGMEIMRACMDGVKLRSAPGHGTSVVLDKRVRFQARVPVPALNRLEGPDQVVCSVCG